MSKAQQLLAKTRGATMIEYALLIVAIMLFAAFAFRKLGNSASQNADVSAKELDNHATGN